MFQSGNVFGPVRQWYFHFILFGRFCYIGRKTTFISQVNFNQLLVKVNACDKNGMEIHCNTYCFWLLVKILFPFILTFHDDICLRSVA